MRARLFNLLIVATVAAACSSTSRALGVSDGVIALGEWGGDSAAMIVSDTAVHLHVSCTYGDMSGRVTVSAAGEFDMTGSYLLRAFPIAVGPTLPARFTGRIDGDVATVLVTVNDTINKTTVVRGPVVVRLGQKPKLMPCPICRRPIVTQAESPKWWLRFLL